jgi:hypothetical protein
MKKLFFALALAVLPATAFATGPGGIDITWQDCVAGSQNVSFNCTASQNFSMHFQFKLPRDLPGFVSMNAYVDYQNSSGAPISPFWEYDGAGCQVVGRTVAGAQVSDDQATASVSAPACGFDPETQEGLLDPWGGSGGGGSESINAYFRNFRRPGNGYMVLLDYSATGAALPLVMKRNYWAFRVRLFSINRASCAGCQDPGVFLLQRMKFESNDGSPDVILDNPDKFGTCLTINNGSPALCPVVPTRNATWGQLKSLYR